MKTRLNCIPLVIACAVLLTLEARAAQDSDSICKSIFEKTNAFRKEEGKSALKLNSKLSNAAQKHAENMAKQEKMAHELDGKGPSDRIKAAGYSYKAWAENVAWEKGSSDPAGTAVSGWKKSPGHRKNMLSTAVTEIGVGAAKSKSGKWYFCQDFGKPKS